MTQAPSSHASFTGSIPRAYHEHLGPVIFEPYARDLAQRVDPRPGLRVLEIACGTGIVTRRLLERLPADARLTATDLNAAMIDEAVQRIPPDLRLATRAADAQDLPFPAASFDVVAIQFGIMFFPDKPRALREAARVLVPAGRLIYNVWGPFAENPFGRLAHETIASFFPVDPPTFYLTPFSWNDPAVIRVATQQAGFGTVEIHEVRSRGVSESAGHFAAGLVDGNPVSAAILERGGDLAAVRAAVADRLARELGSRPCSTPLMALVVEARK